MNAFTFTNKSDAGMKLGKRSFPLIPRLLFLGTFMTLCVLPLCFFCAMLASPASRLDTPARPPVTIYPTILGILPTAPSVQIASATPFYTDEMPVLQLESHLSTFGPAEIPTSTPPAVDVWSLSTETPVPIWVLPTPFVAPLPLPTETPVPVMPAMAPMPVSALRYPCLAGLSWEHAELVATVNGDTIDVRLDDGRIERVRYIGVDTPERGEPGYEQAKQANAALLKAPLFLAKDVSDRDRFGRLLRYVVSEFGSISHELIAQGWARTLTIPPDVRCADELVRLQGEAQMFGRGIWMQVQAAPTMPVQAVPTTPAQLSRNCHPSYPDVCIPYPPPYLNCRDIPYRRFRVLPPDPHRFDRDKDGIGCER